MENAAQKTYLQAGQADHSANLSKPGSNEKITKKPAKGSFEFVKSPLDLKKKVKPLPPGKFDPIAAAERQTKQLSAGFKIWIREDLKSLMDAFYVFSRDPQNEENFQLLNNQVHAIKGNAPVMGAKSAGMIACPLSTLLEGCSEHKKAKPIIALSINAISRAIEQEIAPDDQELLELVSELNRLNENCRLAKSQDNDNNSNNVSNDILNKKNQAAGKDRFPENGENPSCSLCPETCEESCLQDNS